MRVAVTRLLVAVVIEWLVLGALLANDMLCSSKPTEDYILAGASAALIVTSAVFMAMFATAVPSGGSLSERLALALVAATTSATLMSSSFWIGVSTADFACEDSGTSVTLVLVILWGLTAGVMAIAGVVAWGITRMVVRVMTG